MIYIKHEPLPLFEGFVFDPSAPQFRRWCKAKGKILPGLLNRRNAEAELWLKEGE